MSYVIKPKRSENAGAAPTTSDLSAGEFAINTTDGAMFAASGGGAIKRFGIVEGSPQENQVGRYDGTKFVPSLLEVDADGIIAGDGGNLNNVNALTVNSTGIVVLTQSAYNAITPVATTLYFII